ncbi:MAG: TonB-dependent receptor, partial [Amphiplicatus sp.]
VQLNYFNSYGAFDAKNRAFYIQDDWNVTDQMTLSLGVRRDDFKVFTADGNILAEQSANYAPRVGFSYDLWGNGSGKLYGSYGIYYLPFASNTAFRMTGYELYFRELWNFSGFNGDGVPNLTAQLGPTGAYASNCPFGLTPGSSGAGSSVCSVTGDGTVAPSEALISRNLKATKEREFIIGYEHRLTDLWTLGINYTRRNLLRTAEDAAIDAAVLDYCDNEGITGCSSTWTGFHQYVIINPGQDAEIVLDGLDGRTVTFTAEQLGYGDAERTYQAVEFTFERAFDGKWSLKGSYSWSESEGNSEGFVQSDFGQADAGITQDFDQPTFVDGAYGLLPNHRRHRIKFWGNYAVTDRLVLGTNVQIASPRPLSCLGFHPQDNYNNFGNLYGAASHYCGGVSSPRGTAQKTDWQKNVNVSVRYNIDIPSGQQVTLRGDVFNIFNFDGVTERNEVGDLRNPATFGDTTPVPSPNFGQATAYQEPRYVRIGADINF